MMPQTIVKNRNRAHAVQQLKKGIKDEHAIGDVNLLAAIANAIIYVGDEISDLNKTMQEREEIDDGG